MQKRHHKRQRENRCLFLRIFCRYVHTTNLYPPTGALDSKAARQLLESFETLNQKLAATILMVTHDAFTASYADRILFIKDGMIFNELIKGSDTRKEFFEKIIEIVTLLGGELNDVI